MTVARRTIIRTLAAAVAVPASARAQGSWPERPIALIVPFAPGSATNILGRLVGAGLAGPLGRPVVVDNRPGAAANIGTAALARAAPDGRTTGLITLTTYGLNPWLYGDWLPFDPEQDFAPISKASITANTLVGNPRRVPVTTVPELVAWLRGRGGEANSGSPGAGAATHVAMELFLSAAGVRATHVPYRGSAPMLTSLVAGQLALAMDARRLGRRCNRGRSGPSRRPAPRAPTSPRSCPPLRRAGVDPVPWTPTRFRWRCSTWARPSPRTRRSSGSRS